MSFDRIHCRFLSESAPAFTEEPRDQSAREGNNITLEWRYNFGGGSFRQLLFENTDVTIVDKYADDKVPYITPAYSGRLQANVTDTYTSITFLRVNRTDATRYTLEISEKSTRERAKSQVEISVECKYKKTNKTIYTFSIYFCYAKLFLRVFC